jgi:hypothetical protein
MDAPGFGPYSSGKNFEIGTHFGATDRLPDVVVYPVLLEIMHGGEDLVPEISNNRSLVRLYNLDCALALIQARALGGCSYEKLLVNKEPRTLAPGALRWVRKIPRELLEDAYVLSYGVPKERMTVPLSGSLLIGQLEPDNPRWQRAPTRAEFRAAGKRLLRRTGACRIMQGAGDVIYTEVVTDPRCLHL